MGARIVGRTLSMCVLLSAFALLGSLGCAFGEIYWSDPLKREYSLQEVQKRYTDLVRFSQFDQASQFVDSEVRKDFVANAPDWKEIRFTDYESEPIDIDEETGRAIIKVTYTAYRSNSPIEEELVETQEWFRVNVMNSWQVRPTFEGMVPGFVPLTGSSGIN